MKLIGITGKTGAGKTTLADIMGRKQNVGVIHVDELMDNVKRKKLSGLMDHDEQGSSIAFNKKFEKILYSNKYIFLMAIKIKGRLLNKRILDEIERLKAENKEMAVIECVYLKYFPIFKDLDKRILVQRTYEQRKSSVLERDKNKKMDEETFVRWDTPYKRSYYKEDVGSYEYKVENTSIEDLEKFAEEFYTELNEKPKPKRKIDQYKIDVKGITDINKKDISNNNKKSRENEHNR